MNYLEELKKLLAVEYNCEVSDFDKPENVLTISALNAGRRAYSDEKYFFHMATFGKNSVITADERLHGFLGKYIAEKQGHWLFEQPNLLPIERELNRFGYTLTASHHMFLPKCNVEIAGEFPVKWFFGKEELAPFYEGKRFPNALCESYSEKRPDRIAVCAYDNGEIIGMAGCSEDAVNWLQIGVDVIPEYRGRGVGTFLVNLLKNEIIKRDAIPFYGTALTNIHSQNIALNCGFRPVWTEIGAEKR